MRRILLWTAILGAAVVLVIFGIWTALWISVGGTFFRGEQVTLGTIFQIGLAILSCVGLAFLIRSMFRAASKA
jgi:ABC-type polysaccharide/polyol phosphate export permease